MSAISVFRVKFNVEFTRQAVNFSIEFTALISLLMKMENTVESRFSNLQGERKLVREIEGSIKLRSTGWVFV